MGTALQGTIKHVPNAAHKNVHDHFHIMQHVGQAMDKVRRQEHRKLLREEDVRLKGTKYIWPYQEENLPDKHRMPLEALKATNLKVANAWAMKECLSGLWNYLSAGWAKRFMKRWLTWAKNSGLTPLRKIGEIVSRHLDYIQSFCRHRITNGSVEGINSMIMAIKRRAYGYRNRGHFKTAIFFCGDWTSSPNRPERHYPRETRKNQNCSGEAAILVMPLAQTSRQFQSRLTT